LSIAKIKLGFYIDIMKYILALFLAFAVAFVVINAEANPFFFGGREGGWYRPAREGGWYRPQISFVLRPGREGGWHRPSYGYGYGSGEEWGK